MQSLHEYEYRTICVGKNKSNSTVLGVNTDQFNGFLSPTLIYVQQQQTILPQNLFTN